MRACEFLQLLKITVLIAARIAGSAAVCKGYACQPKLPGT